MDFLQDIKEIVSNINSPTWVDGFIAGCWLIFTILLAFSFFGTNLEYVRELQKRNIPENYSFNLPNENTDFSIFSGKINAKCLNDFKFENPNGIKFNGRICINEKIPIGNYYIELIDLNQAIESPIIIKIYKRNSIRWLFTTLVVILPLFLIRRIRDRKKSKKEFEERYKRTQKINKKIKKLGLSPEELKEYIKDTNREE